MNRVLAFIPGYVYDGILKETLPKELTRQELTTILRKIFHEFTRFEGITGDFSPIEAFFAAKHALTLFGERAEYEKKKQMMEKVFCALFEMSLEEAWNRVHAMALEEVSGGWEAFKATEPFKTMLSFRNSGLQVALFNGERAFLYDLMFVLRRGIITDLGATKFEAELIHALGPDEATKCMRRLKRGNPVLWLRLKDLRDRPKKIILEVNNSDWKQGSLFIYPLDFPGEVWTDHDLNPIIRLLQGTTVVAFCLKGDTRMLQYQHRSYLPPLFRLYPARLRRNRRLQEGYSIALGREALLLASLCRKRCLAY